MHTYKNPEMLQYVTYCPAEARKLVLSLKPSIADWSFNNHPQAKPQDGYL